MASLSQLFSVCAILAIVFVWFLKKAVLCFLINFNFATNLYRCRECRVLLAKLP